MKRDSSTTSIWQQTNQTKTPGANNNPETTTVYDVIIIGAGITGLTTGLFLTEAGKKCLILEAKSLGYGTTSGTTAHLNTVLDTPYTTIIHKFCLEDAVLTAKGAKEAIQLIHQNSKTYGIDCDFKDRDGYLYAENEEEADNLDRIYDSLKQVNIDVCYADSTPVPIAFTKALRFSGQAQFHPVKYLVGLAEVFREKGGIIMENTPVDKVHETNGVQLVHTEKENYMARDVVYATHIPFGLNALHFKCAPYRSYVIGVTLPQIESYPEALIYDSKDPYHYFRTVDQPGNAKVLLIGGFDHKTGHEINTDYVFTELEAYARKYYDIKKVVYKWSSQYYQPADGLPYIGQLPGENKHIFIATGYSGNGMIFGTLSGRIIADLILSGESRYADLFSPARVKFIAAAKNMLTENFDVAKHFIADRLSIEALPEFSELSKGEGRVVQYNEHKLAIYKDDQGALKALHPICPHAGCVVEWNNAEKSWDCPCHGARYDIDGNFLNGPTVDPLKMVPLDAM